MGVMARMEKSRIGDGSCRGSSDDESSVGSYVSTESGSEVGYAGMSTTSSEESEEHVPEEYFSSSEEEDLSMDGNERQPESVFACATASYQCLPHFHKSGGSVASVSSVDMSINRFEGHDSHSKAGTVPYSDVIDDNVSQDSGSTVYSVNDPRHSGWFSLPDSEIVTTGMSLSDASSGAWSDIVGSFSDESHEPDHIWVPVKLEFNSPGATTTLSARKPTCLYPDFELDNDTSGSGHTICFLFPGHLYMP
jgi:hypothetical protein